VLGLLLVRGIAAEPTGAPPAAARPSVAVDPATAAFAVRFVRTYLADPSGVALAPFMAEGTRVGAGTSPQEGTGDVAQAEVSGVEDLGGGRAVLTVACELRDARTLYLAVPIVRSRAGEVAALDAPSIVAAPGAAGVDSNEQPQAVAGVSQLGSDEGPSRTVLAAARVADPASGAVYPVAYRLELVKRGGRWYVEAVEGAGA
jgi:hypothetical protein